MCYVLQCTVHCPLKRRLGGGQSAAGSGGPRGGWWWARGEAKETKPHLPSWRHHQKKNLTSLFLLLLSATAVGCGCWRVAVPCRMQSVVLGMRVSPAKARALRSGRAEARGVGPWNLAARRFGAPGDLRGGLRGPRAVATPCVCPGGRGRARQPGQVRSSASGDGLACRAGRWSSDVCVGCTAAYHTGPRTISRQVAGGPIAAAGCGIRVWRSLMVVMAAAQGSAAQRCWGCALADRTC